MVFRLPDDAWGVMEQVYRHTLEETCLECPSGCLDGEPSEVAP